MLSDKQLKEKLEQSPSANRLTEDGVKSKIVDTKFHRLTDRLTVAVVTTISGFEIVGESACADPANYNQEIGEKIAYEDAVHKLWSLEGYLLKESLRVLPEEDKKAA